MKAGNAGNWGCFPHQLERIGWIIYYQMICCENYSMYEMYMQIRSQI